MKLIVGALCTAIFLSSAAGAGTPFEDTMTCPVGGEEFTIVSTASCSTMGRTMSFRPVTSCDFVTRLPICPNGLPVYREFTAAETEALGAFVESEAFAELLDLPGWQRAYEVAGHLGERGTGYTFSILLSAFWYENDSFMESANGLDALLEEAEQELVRTPESAPYLHALLGYALTQAGRDDEAQARLDLTTTQADLEAYVAQVRACQGDVSREGCRPLDRMP